MEVVMRKVSIFTLFVLTVFISVSTAMAESQITLAAASVGGAWSAIGQGIGECVKKLDKDVVFTLQPGADGANAIRVNNGQIDLGIVHSGIAKAALAGSEPFQKPQPDVRAISVLYGRAMYHLAVLKKSGLTDISQIKEKKYPFKVSMNTKGSFMEMIGRSVLAGYGITYDDINNWGGQVAFMSMNASFPLIQDGRLESMSNVIQIPSSHIKELSVTHELVLLPIKEEVQKKLSSDLGVAMDTIPKGTYSFMEKDVPTVSASVILISSSKMSEATAYLVTKAIHDNLQYLATVHQDIQNLTPEIMAKVGDVPLHPGALKFYKEKGIVR
jgi:uncharacterized protein